MSGRLRLVIFDVDGTLVDSQHDILAAMRAGFDVVGEEAPAREAILGIVGLSLDVAVARLAPGLSEAARRRIVEGYKDAYTALRAGQGVALSSPLYPQARETLDALRGVPELLLGVATGKSARGLAKLVEGHLLDGYFVTRQVADHHPSKPHPAMLHAALAETGVDPRDAVMVGDTSYDMDMARAAGIAGIGVTWGYHRAEALTGAARLVGDFDALATALTQDWGAWR
ncbi:HAD-IA family hydrolase [Roseovarius ramblicola]|uniref:HAD-IA family hydrolase n=1 Tax=Roseovarius ramblicola TaxID=2022336 RepID=A0ABV5HZW9_9RHOB